MTDRATQRWLVGFGCLVVFVLGAAPAVASPPVTVRGLDVPTALTFYDRARKLSSKVKRDGNGDDGTSADDETAKLRRVDTVVIDPGHGDDAAGAIGVTGVAEKYLNLELAYDLRERLQRRYPGLRVVLTRYWDQSVSLEDRTDLANRIDADLFISIHYNAATHDRAVGIETYYLCTEKATPGYQLEKKEDDDQENDEPDAATSDAESDEETSEEPTDNDERSSERADSDDETDEVRAETDDSSDDRSEPHPADDSREDTLAAIRRDLRRGSNHRWSGWFAETLQSRLMAHTDTVDRGVKQANFAVLRGATMPAVVVEGGFMSHPEEGRQILTSGHRQKLAESISEAIRAYDARRAKALGTPESSEGESPDSD